MGGVRSELSAKETLTDLLLEFIEAAVHELLFAWQIYPNEAFEKRVLYEVPIHMSRHPQLCEYVHSMLRGCRPWILAGEIEKLSVVALSAEGRTMETFVIEIAWTRALASMDEGKPIPLVQMEEEFRTAMVAIVATPLLVAREDHPPSSFRILAHTIEDASNIGAAINEEHVESSWVLADRFWCEEEAASRALFPVKSIQTDEFPFRMQLYLKQ